MSLCSLGRQGEEKDGNKDSDDGTTSIIHNKYKIFDAQSLGTHEDALIFLKNLTFSLQKSH